MLVSHPTTIWQQEIEFYSWKRFSKNISSLKIKSVMGKSNQLLIICLTNIAAVHLNMFGVLNVDGTCVINMACGWCSQTTSEQAQDWSIFHFGWRFRHYLVFCISRKWEHHQEKHTTWWLIGVCLDNQPNQHHNRLWELDFRGSIIPISGIPMRYRIIRLTTEKCILVGWCMNWLPGDLETYKTTNQLPVYSRIGQGPICLSLWSKPYKGKAFVAPIVLLLRDKGIRYSIGITSSSDLEIL